MKKTCIHYQKESHKIIACNQEAAKQSPYCKEHGAEKLKTYLERLRQTFRSHPWQHDEEYRECQQCKASHGNHNEFPHCYSCIFRNLREYGQNLAERRDTFMALFGDEIPGEDTDDYSELTSAIMLCDLRNEIALDEDLPPDRADIYMRFLNDMEGHYNGNWPRQSHQSLEHDMHEIKASQEAQEERLRKYHGTILGEAKTEEERETKKKAIADLLKI